MTRDEMILNNQKLVYTVTKNYNFEDAYNEGIIGLIKAVDSYKKSSGYEFSTYATVCIKNHLNTYYRNLHITKRKSHAEAISIEVEIGENLEMIDVLGEYDNISYIDIRLDIISAINKLNDEEIKLCKHLLTKNSREIAEIYGLSKQAIQQRIKVIREKLKKEMAKC